MPLCKNVSFARTPSLLLSLMLAGTASAQLSPFTSTFTYEGCANLSSADFAIDTLVRSGSNTSVQEPLKMAFGTDAQGNVDVYFTQRYGRVQKYSGATGTTVTIANFAWGADSVPVTTSSPTSTLGLHGIALDPDFKTNGWLYLYAAVGAGNLGNPVWRVSRYKLNGNVLDLASEKTILRFASNSSSQHMGGVIRFDKDGNLWVTVGDNGGSANPASFTAGNPFQAANTNSLLGKILRIKPKALPDNQPAPAPGAGATYDVPVGNLFPPGTAQTLPEIYVMGTRNAYTLAIDSVRGGIAWGDVGPDVANGATLPSASTNPAQQAEEFNFTTTPGNFGWPYWAGNQLVINTGGGTPDAPVNTRPDNTGLATLPAARSAVVPYGRDCAVTGSVYYYSGSLASPVKFPPHFHGAWMIGDFNKHWIDGVKLDPAGSQVQARARLFAPTGSANLLNLPFLNNPSGSLLEQQFGPDGALYILNYNGYRSTTANTGLYRVRYRGSCQPTVVSLAEDRAIRLASQYRLERGILTIKEPGAHRVEVRDVTGRLLWSRQGHGPALYNLRDLHAISGAWSGSRDGRNGHEGVRILTVTGASGRFVRKLAP